MSSLLGISVRSAGRNKPQCERNVKLVQIYARIRAAGLNSLYTGRIRKAGGAL